MRRKKIGELEWLEFDLFAPFEEIAHGSFIRSPEIENRDKICEVLGLSKLISIKQEHNKRCQHVKNQETLGPGDILLTQEKGIGLAMHHADCQAAILYDPVTKSIGALHAGWRGQVMGIYQEAIRQMGILFGTRPEDLSVAVSPSLGPNHSEFINYQVEWPEEFWDFRIGENYFDLWKITEWQLQKAGVKREQIAISRLCTYADPSSFFSYRRDKTRDRQHATIIGLRNV